MVYKYGSFITCYFIGKLNKTLNFWSNFHWIKGYNTCTIYSNGPVIALQLRLHPLHVLFLLNFLAFHCTTGGLYLAVLVNFMLFQAKTDYF